MTAAETFLLSLNLLFNSVLMVDSSAKTKMSY